MKDFLKKLKQKINSLKEDVVVLYLALKDERVPLVAKVFILLVVGYAISPIDFIPDFIPILGYLDDLILLPIGIYICIKLIPKHVLADLREKAREMPKLKKNKIAGVVIIAIWILIVILILNYILRG